MVAPFAAAVIASPIGWKPVPGATTTRLVASHETRAPAARFAAEAFGNKAASGTAGVDGAVQALRAMTGLDGMKLNIQPKFLVVGPAQEANARRILASIDPTTAADVNPWANAFTLIVDAEIVGNRWFLIADPTALLQHIELVRLVDRASVHARVERRRRIVVVPPHPRADPVSPACRRRLSSDAHAPRSCR